MLLKLKQHKLWKSHHAATEVLRSSHCNSTASSVPEWQKNPNTKKKPFKINSTRNADVLNKGSVVMAAKFQQNEIETSKVHCSKLIIL